LDREFLAAVQTPQIFERLLFVNAYEYAKKNQFKGTDDSSILEYSNFFPRLLRGEERNLKITTELDLELAEFLLKS
jgi:2-C-methyl-D-erythritol 4-phosphate cytidylyltransferase